MRNARIIVCLAVVCVMAIANFALADTIQGINIDFINIGNAGNAADATGFGAVGNAYRIGKYEVTNAQWNAFTSAAGAPTGNDGGYSYIAYYGDQQPTNCVSWYETLQFCNYLTSGDKSKGVYRFSGDNTNPGDFLGIDRDTATATYGTTYFLPTENEWYKAAYFKPNGSGYSLYANGTNNAPFPGAQSNYNAAIGTPWNVGTGVEEQNGTYDMMGNIWEWNEALLYGSSRGLRGGSYYIRYDGNAFLASSYRGNDAPYFEGDGAGFRVASVPEPATLLLLGLGGLALRRKKR